MRSALVLALAWAPAAILYVSAHRANARHRRRLAASEQRDRLPDAAAPSAAEARPTVPPPPARAVALAEARATVPAGKRVRLNPVPCAGTPAESPAPPAAGPRLRADIRRTAFASQRLVFIDVAGEPGLLIVDARDVNERDGTVPIEVLDADSRETTVLVRLPPEWGLEGREVWVARPLVLDLVVRRQAAPEAVDSTGDRSGVNPGAIHVRDLEQAATIPQPDTASDRDGDGPPNSAPRPVPWVVQVVRTVERRSGELRNQRDGEAP